MKSMGSSKTQPNTGRFAFMDVLEAAYRRSIVVTVNRNR
jgi:hypothetical protein